MSWRFGNGRHNQAGSKSVDEEGVEGERIGYALTISMIFATTSTSLPMLRPLQVYPNRGAERLRKRALVRWLSC